MATVPSSIGKGEGGAGIAKLAAILNGIADDLAALHAAISGITAQLDTDGGVTGTDFAANNDPPALVTVKEA